jgi:hypothetical protein
VDLEFAAGCPRATLLNLTRSQSTLYNHMGRDGGGGGRGRGRGRGQKQSKMTPRAVVADVKAERKKNSLAAVKKDLRSLTRLLAKVRERGRAVRARSAAEAWGMVEAGEGTLGVSTAAYPFIRSQRHRPVLASQWPLHWTGCGEAAAVDASARLDAKQPGVPRMICIHFGNNYTRTSRATRSAWPWPTHGW